MNESNILVKGKFGIEKENLRVSNRGELSLKKHPKIFGKRNQYITTDFSESQIEIITPTCNSIEEAYHFLENLNTIVMLNLEDELLWVQSNPPILPSESQIPIAIYDDLEKERYRDYLSNKYGKKRAVLSGIHFNFSFLEEELKHLYQIKKSESSYLEFKDNLYLKVTKYFMKYRWLWIQLFGASPVFHESYVKQCVDFSNKQEDGSCTIEGMQSLRNSVCGYRNSEYFFLNYTSYLKYVQSVEQLIEQKKIRQLSELYTAIRIKSLDNHINYLEFRFLDINPLFPNGINIDDLKLIHMFVIYFAQLEDFEYDNALQTIADLNQDISAQSASDTEIFNDDNTLVAMNVSGESILNHLYHYLNAIEFKEYDYKNIIQATIQRLKHREMSYSSIIREKIKEFGYIEFHNNQSLKFLDQAKKRAFTLSGYSNMELSTQVLIQSALKFGLTVEILDRGENFIRLTNPHNKHSEYIKEATKTSLDTYSQVLVMENKQITKQILHEHSISVPKGYIIHQKEEAIHLYDRNQLNKSLVVKPNSTNFGKGITIFPTGYSKEQLSEAIDFAFLEDTTVLLEKFQVGKEYRILIVGNEVEAILHRRAANVMGDGIHTIEELVIEKNKDPLRSQGYKTPLEILNLNKPEKDFLANQNLSITSITKKGKRVFLRENSNISTGGDSIDFTDEVHNSYLNIALAAAKALEVQICGVDMIIEDISVPANTENYSIIEANFNPAIHIHCYPYRGKNRNIGDKIIKLLFFNGKEKY